MVSPVCVSNRVQAAHREFNGVSTVQAHGAFICRLIENSSCTWDDSANVSGSSSVLLNRTTLSRGTNAKLKAHLHTFDLENVDLWNSYQKTPPVSMTPVIYDITCS